MTAYLITKTGSEVYYRRQNVVRFILDFQEIQRGAVFHTYDISQVQNPLSAEEPGAFPLSGQLQTSSAIHQILRQAAVRPDGVIRVIAQPEHLESLNIAAALPQRESSLQFHHILCINNAEASSGHSTTKSAMSEADYSFLRNQLRVSALVLLR